MKTCGVFILAIISIFNENRGLVRAPPPFGEAFVDKQILRGMIEVWWVPISVLGVWCF